EAMASGDELLIVDENEQHRAMLRAFFEEAGYVCTAVGNLSDAQYLAGRKFFPAALIDLDVDHTGGGIELIRWVRSHSSETAVVAMAGRRAYGIAVEAFRLGVVDVVSKSTDEMLHLKKVVEIASDRYRATNLEGSLLHEVQSVLEEALRV